MSINLRALPLTDAIAWVDRSPSALLSLGIPKCPASRALEASLEAIARSRPQLPIVLVVLDGPADWVLREELLWPREIRVSRSSVPVLVVLQNGKRTASRHGSAPAHELDRWLTTQIGPPERPPNEVVTERESGVLEETAARRAQHSQVKGRREPGL